MVAKTIDRAARAQAILTCLDSNTWIGRAELAQRLGRRTLNMIDHIAMAELEFQGQIESKQEPDSRPMGFVWQYRRVQS